MAPSVEDLNRFLQTLSGGGSEPPLLVRDPEAGVGWRPWTQEDSDALYVWMATEFREVAKQPNLECFTQKEAAAVLGISVPKITEWVRRPDNPLPHVQDGRMVYIPFFLLMEWLREESTRSVGGG